MDFCSGPLAGLSKLPAVPGFQPFSFMPAEDADHRDVPCEDYSFFLEFTQDEGHPDAKCLDGSSGSFYTSVVENARGTVVIFGNEGLCVTEDECASRAEASSQSPCTGFPGSSIGLPPALHLDQYSGSALFSSDRMTNPIYYNYNKVFVNDCDGGAFSSSRGEVTVDTHLHGGVTINMNGKQIVESLFDHLNENEALAGNVVLASHGYASTGVLAWISDHVEAEFGIVAKSLVYSGYYPEYTGEYSSRMDPYSNGKLDRWGAPIVPFVGTYEEFWNTAASTHQFPISYPDILTPHLLMDFAKPVLLLGSRFDPWQLSSAFGFEYTVSNAREWASNFDSSVAAVFADSSNDVSVVMSSCPIYVAQAISPNFLDTVCPAPMSAWAWEQTYGMWNNDLQLSVDVPIEAYEAKIGQGATSYMDTMQLFQSGALDYIGAMKFVDTSAKPVPCMSEW